MDSLSRQIHAYIDDGDTVRLLKKYYAGRYTGSRFDVALQLESPDPNRFTAHDMAAVATLSVPLSGAAVVGLIGRDEQLAIGLQSVPADLDLADASDVDLEAVFEVQRELDGIEGIGHVTRSKLLAHKRPRLVPIRDQHVLAALTGQTHGPFTAPLRDALAADRSIRERLEAVSLEAVLDRRVSMLRVLDVIVWMAVHGDSQVPDFGLRSPHNY